MDDVKILSTLDKVEKGLNSYIAIMNRFKEVDVSEDKDFQKLFNSFYKIRLPKAEFYDVYYKYFEECKNRNITFSEILKYLSEKFGRIEASFSSKLLATINPNKPVWDKYVLKNFKLKKTKNSDINKIENAVNLYDELKEKYRMFMKTEEANYLIKMFNNRFPHAKITDIKKIDLILWQSREEEFFYKYLPNKGIETVKCELKDNLRGRKFNSRIIPTVCNLKNMLDRLIAVNGEYNQLKAWEKQCYKAYHIDEIYGNITNKLEHEWPHVIREHILLNKPTFLGQM